jgi:hypothetical protein
MQKALAVILIICLLSLGTLSAQSFSISNDSLTGTTDANRPEFVLKTNINNLLTNRPISLKWERYENDFSSSWLGNQICVNGTCYFYNVDTGTIIIAADTSESFDAHFGNNNLPGEGYMRVRIYETGDTAGTTVQNIYFGAKITPGTSVPSIPMSNSNLADIQIYPNPAREYVIIKRSNLMNINRIEVYNMLGLKVISQYPQSGEAESRIDLMDLQKGVYMIRIFDKSNNVILTKSISKIR